MFYKFKPTYDHNHDSFRYLFLLNKRIIFVVFKILKLFFYFRILYLIIPALVLSFVIVHVYTVMEVSF